MTKKLIIDETHLEEVLEIIIHMAINRSDGPLLPIFKNFKINNPDYFLDLVQKHFTNDQSLNIFEIFSNKIYPISVENILNRFLDNPTHFNILLSLFRIQLEQNLNSILFSEKFAK